MTTLPNFNSFLLINGNVLFFTVSNYKIIKRNPYKITWVFVHMLQPLWKFKMGVLVDHVNLHILQ